MISFSQLPSGLLATVLAAVSLSGHHVIAGPSLHVDMKAAFPSSPYIVELLETAAGENSSSYIPLLDRIAAGHFAQSRTDKELYDSFLDLVQKDGHITSPETLSTFKLALSMREAAPRIEAHYQYYETAVQPNIDVSELSCENWVLVDGIESCSADLSPAGKLLSTGSQTRSLPFDRIMGGGKGRDVVLYADISTSNFGSLHTALHRMAREGEISYRLRYRVNGRQNTPALPVSGYGVELQLKRTDYIVIDDREGDSKASKPPTGEQSPTEVVLDDDEEVTDLQPLSSSELTGLGVKAASFIMQSETPFQTLVKLTQDFPKYSAFVANHDQSEQFLTEHHGNRALGGAPAGTHVLWMNGIQLTERQISPYTLVDLLRRERTMIQGVTDLGFAGQEAISLLGHQFVTEAQSDEDLPRFDWRDEKEGGKVILWLNNILKDTRYAEFPSSLMALMQRTYPGHIPPVRRDMFNVIVPVDLTKANDIGLILGQLRTLIKRGLAIHFGLVPLTPTKVAEDQAKLAYHILESYGLSTLMTWLEACFNEQDILEVDQTTYENAIADKERRNGTVELSLAGILETEHYADRIDQGKQWTERLNADSPIPPVFVNGDSILRDKSWIQAMSMRIGADLQFIQQGVYNGEIEEETWLPGLFLENSMPRRNAYVFPDDNNKLRVLDIHKLYSEHKDLIELVPLVEASPDSPKESWAVLSVLADVTSEPGQKFLLSAIRFRRANAGVRLDIFHNPSNPNSASTINDILQQRVQELLDIDNIEALDTLLHAAAKVSEQHNYAEALGSLLAAVGIEPGASALLLNGRVIGPIQPGFEFKHDDFSLLMSFEKSTRILPVYQALEALNMTEKVSGPLVAAKVTSITALSTISDLPEGIFESAPTLRMTMFDEWETTHTMISVGDASKANIHLVALLDPASEQGQKWTAILKVLSELDGVYLRIFLNPKERMGELPVKRFYRYVLASAPLFDDFGAVRSLGANFKGLPSEALLNLGMDVPPAWLVAAKDSVHDLDNLKLSSMKSDVHATYELEKILIEGHSREGAGNPPKGVQLLLGTESDSYVTDTIIMANLGYFQFKANPGYYNIQLKKGRSSEIYNIESVGAKGYSAVPGDEGTEVALMDFQGTTLYPRLRRVPGFEKEDVLEESEASDDILSRGIKFAEGLFGGSKKSVAAQEHAEINIFSVASGHLYERMLNIMMVSVVKNTKHTVKFWFIEQFLSPSFKEFIPNLAREYDFKYEMVTYKWPHWLRQQKEKQREIWGYKILFLDVLFPLSLDKVIFVDADQIVRTDMMDLVNHDLEGAVYGFTPMCDSRVEMEGFRFWKQGYWANYLRGRPYHISALYVVDLRRFRELAAGDRLRQQYHALSADPNSLSNLDQDLPNHMQFQIPIHSLPQEWLWCETWCSDESQAEARTIDLCNNPQTKEPKLDRARRQVPEWTVYDDEIAAVRKKAQASIDESIDGDSDKDGGDGKTSQQQQQQQKNPKSRNMEEHVGSATGRMKDEL